EKAERETKERTGKDKPWKDGDPSSELLEMVQPVPMTGDLPAPVESSSPEIKPVESQTLDPAGILREPSEADKELATANTENGQETPPPPRAVSADQMGMLMVMLGSSLWDGGSHTPQALGVAVALEGDAIAVRALVANASGEPPNVVPFISALIAGPQIVPDSPTIASADTDIFVSTSLDWPRIYDAMLAGLNKRGVPVDEDVDVSAPKTGGATPKPADAEQSIEAVEKLLGFKIKDDLLPSLGNEVAVALPLSWFDSTPKFNKGREAKDVEAKAGPVLLIALNNPDKIRSILPKALALLGVAAPGAGGKTEKRGDFEIQSYGSVTIAFVNNFLVAGEDAPSVRRVVDSYQSQQTLATRAGFRDSGAWQPRQKLAQVFVSEMLMKNMLDDYKRRAEDITDPVLHAMLSGLNVAPQAATYAANDEGGDVLHEVRLPLDLIKAYAAGFAFGIKDAPVQRGEMMALFVLSRIRDAEETFKTTKGEGKFGTLEQLQAQKLLDKNYLAGSDYKIQLTTSGDKYETTATPKEYGKTGRRSFFVDESGIIRAANHKGEPATAGDPPID
ncbi:MAG: DUF3352 domain-containing protein, partial [Acidobacteria bacterium]|nr:DUF3352 domain-containing protein [Acidobacteriota bacterium]